MRSPSPPRAPDGCRRARNGRIRSPRCRRGPCARWDLPPQPQAVWPCISPRPARGARGEGGLRPRRLRPADRRPPPARPAAAAGETAAALGVETASAGFGRFGAVAMGPMFTALKVRAALGPADYRDPGWHAHPPQSRARKIDRALAGLPPRRTEIALGRQLEV